MELTTTSTPTKSADSECDTPPRIIQPMKSLSYTNGPPKKHHNQPPSTVVVTYKECLRNHAASIGGQAVDGCGEFMPTFSSTSNDDPASSLKCAACGCHRNFHRREPDGYSYPPTAAIHFLDYPWPSPSPPPQPLKQQPPPPPSYAPPHMLLSLSTAVHGDERQQPSNNHHVLTPLTPTATRKRSRTKFTQEQKEKMHAFAEKLGWKLQKSDADMVEKFCNDIGVARGVLKVWMHNNKHSFGKKDMINSGSIENGTVITFHNNGYDINSSSNNDANKKISSRLCQTENNGDVHLHDSAIGSSSST